MGDSVVKTLNMIAQSGKHLYCCANDSLSGMHRLAILGNLDPN
jgi:hypothetical protein